MIRSFLLFLAGLSVSTWAHGQTVDVDSGNAYLPRCKAALDDNNTENIHGQGLCQGAIRTMYYVSHSLDSAKFCPPSSATANQMIRVVVNYLEANPQFLHANFHWAALTALQKAWPCR